MIDNKNMDDSQPLWIELEISDNGAATPKVETLKEAAPKVETSKDSAPKEAVVSNEKDSGIFGLPTRHEKKKKYLSQKAETEALKLKILQTKEAARKSQSIPRKSIRWAFIGAAMATVVGLYDWASENTRALPEYPEGLNDVVDTTQAGLRGFVSDSYRFASCAFQQASLNISRENSGQNLYQLTADAPAGSVYLNTGGHPNYNRTPFSLQSGDIIDLGQIDSEGQWRRAFIKSGVNEGTSVWVNQADVVDMMLQNAPGSCGNGMRANVTP